MIRRISRKVKSFWAALALLSVEMSIILVLFVVALGVFVYMIRKVFIQNRTYVDQEIFGYLQNHVSNRNNYIMEFFTFLGTHTFLIPANLILISYFLFIQKHKWYSIKIPAIALSSLGLMFALKSLFHRERPDIPLLQEAKGLSFPSGHALFSVTFYGLLIYIIFKNVKNKELKWFLICLLLLLILTIGFSRIYLRVHYASDVIAGYCVGFLWLVFAVWLLNRMENYSSRKLDPVIERE
ncbi:MAG: phosphatase PAP2 family protein [Candidatus Dadabacteria bacterium]